MKSKTKILTLLAVLIMSTVIFAEKTTAQQGYVSFQVFYDQLSPYGQWVDYPDYGYVWIPDAGSDFAPYSTSGHWIMTDYGWTWMSDYSWGWAPFHYGRWDFDSFYGWFWIPDNNWGPAWVNWRSADGYYGWEPMRPGVFINITFGNDYDYQNDHWIFVRDRDFDRSDINHYYVDHNDHQRIIQNSRVIKNTSVDNSRHTTYVTGPDRRDVQKVTGRRIKAVSISESNKPGEELNNGHFQIYKPQVRDNVNERKSAPTRIVDLKDVKRSSERKIPDHQGDISPNSNPQAPNININSSKPQNSNPTETNRKVIQPDVTAPQNNNSKPANERKTAPARNSRRERQAANVRSSGKNTNDQSSGPKQTRVKKRND